MKIFYGKSLSSSAIALKWVKPHPQNGILKPYEVKCYDMDGVVSWSANALTNTSTSALILGLKPFNEYTCQLKASTIPHDEQNSIDCITMVETSSFRTYKKGEQIE